MGSYVYYAPCRRLGYKNRFCQFSGWMSCRATESSFIFYVCFVLLYFGSLFFSIATWQTPAVCLPCSFVGSSRQMLLPRYLMIALNNSDMDYSVAPTDALIKFWRSEVKGQGYSRPSRWRRHPRWHLGIKVHLLVVMLVYLLPCHVK